VQSLLNDQGPAGDPRARSGHVRPHGNPAAAARDLSGLPRSDRAKHPRGASAGDGALGAAIIEKALLDAASKRADKLRAKGQDIDLDQMLRMEPDKGTTNVRNTTSKHWQRWLGPENRCVVPFTSFCEPDQASSSLQPTWFALGDDRPLAFFAGIHAPAWTSVRKIKEGEIMIDLFGFLTTDANAEVRAVHPKAMPVILRTPEEIELWMTAPTAEALTLQRPLPDGSLKIVARGSKMDGDDAFGRIAG
jgi:putative SOS response-associated peptidase YedK